MDKNKEKLYSKALEQINKQAKKRGIQFSFVKPVKEVENDNR
jgi:hypothetical protein